jgi:hypothetical protein
MYNVFTCDKDCRPDGLLTTRRTLREARLRAEREACVRTNGCVIEVAGLVLTGEHDYRDSLVLALHAIALTVERMGFDRRAETIRSLAEAVKLVDSTASWSALEAAAIAIHDECEAPARYTTIDGARWDTDELCDALTFDMASAIEDGNTSDGVVLAWASEWKIARSDLTISRILPSDVPTVTLLCGSTRVVFEWDPNIDGYLATATPADAATGGAA